MHDGPLTQQRSPAFGHTAKAGGSYVQPPVRVAQVRSLPPIYPQSLLVFGSTLIFRSPRARKKFRDEQLDRGMGNRAG